MCPVLDSPSFDPVPTLLRKLATILLLAFSLFELVASLSQCVYVQRAKRRMEESVNTHSRLKYLLTNKMFLLHIMYKVRTYDFSCKLYNNKMFFSLLVQRRDRKARFLLFYCALKMCMILYSTATVYFHCSIVS